MPTASVPLLELVRRGETREMILSMYRDSLRELVDPESGQAIGEDQIRLATMFGSRFYTWAEGIDVVVGGIQRRAEFLAENVDPRRASTAVLEAFHGPAAKLPRLQADGGSGVVKGTASPGAVFIGSSQIPNELATRAQDATGLFYQVVFNATTPNSGDYRVTLKGIDGGRETNLKAGAKLKWMNPPPGAVEAEVVNDFAGGASLETDQEWGERLFDARGSRPKSGNAAHFRLWARRVASSIDAPYVYPSGLGSGTVVVAITQKRSGIKGPFARIPTAGLMTIITGFLTPPASPMVPGQARVVVVPVRPQLVDGAILLGLKHGSAAGWADIEPWPRIVTTAASVIATPAPTQTVFYMRSDVPLPSTGIPQLMIWNAATSEYERLSVATIAAAGTDFVVTLAQSHAGRTITAGDVIAPYTARSGSISKGIVAYFDALGPGEVVEPTSARLAIVFRRPAADLTEPSAAGERVISFISQAIGGSIEKGSVVSFAPETPSIPLFSVSQGPFLLVPGNIAISPA